MTQSTQGIIIALLISLLIGVIIGFYLRQGRINDLSKALKQQKKRTAEVEQEHEKRLQEATIQLQKDYEAQLADKIELYQTQYDEQVNQLESEYEARLTMMGPAMAGADPTTAMGDPVMAAGASADAVAIEQRIRKQYETRLKEAAQKIQQAYEQHLKVKLNESREALQQDYEQRLAEKIEHYQDQLEEKLAQATPAATLSMQAMTMPAMADPAPRGAMIPRVESPLADQRATLEAEIRREYEQKLAEKIEHYQDDLAQRIDELEKEYEARLRMVQAAQAPTETAVDAVSSLPSTTESDSRLAADLEARFNREYEQRLAAAIEGYQDEMVQRTQDLEREYEARLQLMQQQLAQATPPVDEPDTAPADVAPGQSPFSNLPGSAPMANPPQGIADVDETIGPPAPESGLSFPQEPPEVGTAPEAENTAIPENALFGDTDLDMPELNSPAAGADALNQDFGRTDLSNDFDLAEPPSGRQESSNLDLDDLLTLDQEDISPDENAPLDDGGFDLDNLEALLQEQNDNDIDTDPLFDNLDDLSNLS